MTKKESESNAAKNGIGKKLKVLKINLIDLMKQIGLFEKSKTKKFSLTKEEFISILDSKIKY